MTYSFFSISKQKNRCYNRAVLFYDKEGNFIKRLWDEESISKKEIKPPIDAKFMRIQVSSQNTNSNNHAIKVFMLEGSMPNNYTFDLWENQQDWLINNDFCVEPEANKTTILLSTQLQKVGKIADKLYWDSAKGRYVIEKNIDSELCNPYEGLHGGLNANVNATTINGVRVCNKFYVDKPIDDKNKLNHGCRDYIITKFRNDIYNYHKPFTVMSFDGWQWIELSFPVDIGIDTSEKAINYCESNNIRIYYQLKTSQIINTNITSKIEIPTYKGKTHIYTKSENGINPALKVVVDRLPQIAKEAVTQAESDSTNYNISLARMYVNMLPESLYKDQLQEQLGEVFSADIALDRKSATGNLDVYIKSENMLSMSLDTNSVTFDDYSGTEDMEMLGAVNISINSSLPYKLNAYMPTEITNNDKSEFLPIDTLNIREESEGAYQTFTNTTDKIVLKDNCAKGNGLLHNIDLKLSTNLAHKADVYKTVIKFEAQQK